MRIQKLAMVITKLSLIDVVIRVPTNPYKVATNLWKKVLVLNCYECSYLCDLPLKTFQWALNFQYGPINVILIAVITLPQLTYFIFARLQ